MDMITGLHDKQNQTLSTVLSNLDRMTGLQDLMDRVMGLSWGLTMDMITG